MLGYVMIDEWLGIFGMIDVILYVYMYASVCVCELELGVSIRVSVSGSCRVEVGVFD